MKVESHRRADQPPRDKLETLMRELEALYWRTRALKEQQEDR